MIQKLKNTIKRNVDYCVTIEKKKDFDYIGGQEKRRKAGKNVHQNSQSRYDFIDIWFRYLLTQHITCLISPRKLNQSRALSSRKLSYNQLGNS